MNRKSISLKSALSVSLTAAALFVAGAAAAPASGKAEALPASPVKVQVNSDLVAFPDAQPYIDGNGATQVPVRFVGEGLGYSVNWSQLDSGGIEVRLANSSGKVLELETGVPVATVNGSPLDLSTSPVLRDGRVYVPLRFISEAKGIRVQWDSINRIAILNEDGNYHAPAYYAPQKKLIDTFTASAYSADPKENGGFGAVDYFGNPLQLGTVAVDPSVIPLGTRLYIEGYNFPGLPEGGMEVIARDTGGAMKGKRMDIFIPGSRQSLLNFGFQEIKVYRMPE